MKIFCFVATLAMVFVCTAATQAGLFDIETKLTAADAAAGDRLGISVAISGNMALVGASGDDDAGAAYLFDVTTGNQIKLSTDDATGGHKFGNFGNSVAISGNMALVGHGATTTLAVILARLICLRTFLSRVGCCLG